MYFPAQQKKEWDLALKVYTSEVDMEKHRINAIRDIAVAYYKHAPRAHYRELAEE